MATSTLLFIDATVEFKTAFHLGSGGEGPLVDATILRAVDGEVVLDGEQLAGALRAIAETIGPVGTAASLFGDRKVTQGSASKLVVSDGWPTGDVPTAVRDGVGIDRATGAAQKNVKFDREVALPGAKFTVRFEAAGLDDAERTLLRTVLGQAGQRLRLGAGVARGLGAAVLDVTKVHEVDPAVRDVLVKLLLGEDAGIVIPLAEFVLTPERPGLVITALIEVEDLLVGDPAAALGSGYDDTQLIESGKVVLPGSSLRGALRTLAERLVRSVDGGWACDPFDAKSDCATGKTECLPCSLFGNQRVGRRLHISDGIDDSGPEADDRILATDYVAIDRFTGGAAPGAKFDAQSRLCPTFLVEFAYWREVPAARDLLLVLLRDLVRRRVWVGSGSAKGRGRCSASLQSASVQDDPVVEAKLNEAVTAGNEDDIVCDLVEAIDFDRLHAGMTSCRIPA